MNIIFNTECFVREAREANIKRQSIKLTICYVIEANSICPYVFILTISYVIEGNSICAYMFILTIFYVIEGNSICPYMFILTISYVMGMHEYRPFHSCGLMFRFSVTTVLCYRPPPA